MEEPVSAEVKRKVTLTVRGKQYEATIDSVAARAADERSPWQKHDELHAWLSFPHEVGKFPGSTLSFCVVLPVKEYSPAELLKVIQFQGNVELEEYAAKSDADRAYYQAKEARQTKLNDYASRIANSLKEGG